MTMSDKSQSMNKVLRFRKLEDGSWPTVEKLEDPALSYKIQFMCLECFLFVLEMS